MLEETESKFERDSSNDEGENLCYVDIEDSRELDENNTNFMPESEAYRQKEEKKPSKK